MRFILFVHFFALSYIFVGLCAVSPPLPPPPSADVNDHFNLLQSRAFDPRYNAVAGANMHYAADYRQDGGAGRRSQLEEDEEAWMPENYLEKGQLLVSGLCFLEFLEMSGNSAKVGEI